MRTNKSLPIGRTSPVSSAIFRAARLLIFGFIGWLWFFWADNLSWKAVSLVAVLTLTALCGTTWYALHVRAESRRRAALTRYAEREQAKRTEKIHPNLP